MFHKSHYHSTTHEALGVFQGEADLLFGVADSEMTEGKEVKETVQAGDVIVIPVSRLLSGLCELIDAGGSCSSCT